MSAINPVNLTCLAQNDKMIKFGKQPNNTQSPVESKEEVKEIDLTPEEGLFSIKMSEEQLEYINKTKKLPENYCIAFIPSQPFLLPTGNGFMSGQTGDSYVFTRKDKVEKYRATKKWDHLPKGIELKRTFIGAVYADKIYLKNEDINK